VPRDDSGEMWVALGQLGDPDREQFVRESPRFVHVSVT